MKKIPFFKLYLYYLFGAIPISIFVAFLSLFHKFPIQFNDKPTYGIVGFSVCLIFTPIWVFLLHCLNYIFLIFGRWLYLSFCKLTKIKTEEKSSTNPELQSFLEKGNAIGQDL